MPFIISSSDVAVAALSVPGTTSPPGVSLTGGSSTHLALTMSCGSHDKGVMINDAEVSEPVTGVADSARVDVEAEVGSCLDASSFSNIAVSSPSKMAPDMASSSEPVPWPEKAPEVALTELPELMTVFERDDPIPVTNAAAAPSEGP